MSREFKLEKFTKGKPLTVKRMIKFLLPFEPTQKLLLMIMKTINLIKLVKYILMLMVIFV